jgi:hypothetical protein
MREFKPRSEADGPAEVAPAPDKDCSPDDVLCSRWKHLHREHTDAVAAARDKVLRYLVTEGFEVCYERRRQRSGTFINPAAPNVSNDDEGSDGELVAGGSGSQGGLS